MSLSPTWPPDWTTTQRTRRRPTAASRTSSCPPPAGVERRLKEAKTLVPQRVKDVKDWRKRFRRRPGRHDVTTLVELGHQVEDLWTMALRRLTVAEQQTSRDIALWGRDEALASTGRHPGTGGTVPGRPRRRLPAATARHGRLVRPVVLATDHPSGPAELGRVDRRLHNAAGRAS